eukprot:1005883-Rhodomonas_salina.1
MMCPSLERFERISATSARQKGAAQRFVHVRSCTPKQQAGQSAVQKRGANTDLFFSTDVRLKMAILVPNNNSSAREAGSAAGCARQKLHAEQPSLPRLAAASDPLELFCHLPIAIFKRTAVQNVSARPSAAPQFKAGVQRCC